MTLIAGINNNTDGCIISDFRLTNIRNWDQGDHANKFNFIDNRIAIFISGPVFMLSSIVNKINTKKRKITHNNVDQQNGALVKGILEVFKNSQNGTNCSMIIVHLNKNNNTFKMFSLKIFKDKNQLKYNLNSKFDWEVIGSGAIISEKRFYPKREPFSLAEMYRNVRDSGYDCSTATQSIETEIKTRLSSHGPDTFYKLGISPVMNICLIEGGHLTIIGRTVTGKRITSEGLVSTWNYGLEKNPDGKIQLKDYNTGESIDINITDQTFSSKLLNNFKKFDPEELEGTDVSYPSYTLSQIVVPNNKNNLIRLVYRTQYLDWIGQQVMVREPIYIASKVYKDIPPQKEIENYPIIGVVKINNEFENNLNDSLLFDDDWLIENLGSNNPFLINN